MSKIHELTEHGQSIWYDNIRRAMLTSGELQRLINLGVTGVTSNPTIFEKAIVGSADYDKSLKDLTEKGYDPVHIYEDLAFEDIRSAADILLTVYQKTSGLDGYISLEVKPSLANDTMGTIDEAKRLYNAIGRPNLMVKVPATAAGISAFESLTEMGISVNVTLIFSLKQYEDVANAYLAGLEKRATAGKDVSKVASVASFFISRIDSAVDAVLSKLGPSELLGKTAIANAKLAYEIFSGLIQSERWQHLAKLGANPQRPLWASTGTKNISYLDTLYVDSLIAPNTVNTVPPATLEAYLHHGNTTPSLSTGIEQAKIHLSSLESLGISFAEITDRLLSEGLNSFDKSFKTLLDGIVEKQNWLKSGWNAITVNLGEYQKPVTQAQQEIKRDRIMDRIWDHDHTVWKPEPTEITNRLGWLDIANRMQDSVKRIYDLTDKLRAEGYRKAVLLGMGGSSLAPEVFRRTFGVKNGYLDLSIMDTTDPDAILALTHQLDFSKTLFIVSTKSGNTPETLSFFKYFYNQVTEHVGLLNAGKHFIAITDPGSKLAELSSRYSFRDTFLNDPNIGGRYSALSYFGLVPAALIGVDLEEILSRTIIASCNCQGCNCSLDGDNLGGYLGAILGELAKSGRNKATFITSPEIAGFGDWVEQLIAESTGKEGKGILPVVGELPGDPSVYSDDRLFIYIRLEDDDTYTSKTEALVQAGHPLVTLKLKDKYDLGQQFFVWEMATAVAGYRMGINPFDQPNVESAKILTRKMLDAYKIEGKLTEPSPIIVRNDLSVYGNFLSETPKNALQTFLSQAKPGAYVTIQAYLQPTPETDEVLNNLRLTIRDQTRLATTQGYGPRFLHSTGQLHKGDAGRGLFIQLTAAMENDVMIPDEAGQESGSTSFGTLKTAQVLGDFQALVNADRQVIRFDLGQDLQSNLKLLAEEIK